MSPVFVDAVAWIAAANSRDALHQQVWRVLRDLRQRRRRLVTTEFVLLEVADALSSPPVRTHAISFLEGLRRQTLLEIVPATSSGLADGWALYCQRPDKEWGLTDCISFAVMTQRGISEAFTSDHHFEQAGFQKLL